MVGAVATACASGQRRHISADHSHPIQPQNSKSIGCGASIRRPEPLAIQRHSPLHRPQPAARLTTRPFPVHTARDPLAILAQDKPSTDIAPQPQANLPGHAHSVHGRAAHQQAGAAAHVAVLVGPREELALRKGGHAVQGGTRAAANDDRPDGQCWQGASDVRFRPLPLQLCHGEAHCGSFAVPHSGNDRLLRPRGASLRVDRALPLPLTVFLLVLASLSALHTSGEAGRSTREPRR